MSPGPTWLLPSPQLCLEWHFLSWKEIASEFSVYLPLERRRNHVLSKINKAVTVLSEVSKGSLFWPWGFRQQNNTVRRKDVDSWWPQMSHWVRPMIAPAPGIWQALSYTFLENHLGLGTIASVVYTCLPKSLFSHRSFATLKKICFELVVPLGVTKPMKLVVLFWTWIWALSLGRENPSFEHSAFIPLPPISGMDLGILIPFPSGLKRPQLEAAFQSGLSSTLLCELDPNVCADSVLSWTVFVAPPKALAEEGVSFCKWFPTVDGAAGSVTGQPQWLPSWRLETACQLLLQENHGSLPECRAGGSPVS